MAITKDHAIGGAVVAAAMGLGFAFGHAPLVGITLPPPTSAPSAALSAPPPPSKCKQACDSIAPWCSMGRSVTCVTAMQTREADSADGGPHFSCDEPLTQDVLDRFGWCPNHGEEKPMRFGP